MILRAEKFWDRANRVPALPASAGMIVATALVDWWTLPPALCVARLPVFVSHHARSGFLPRTALVAVSVVCAVLTEAFSSLDPSGRDQPVGGGRSGPFAGPFESLGMGKIQEVGTSGDDWVYNHPVRKAKTEIPHHSRQDAAGPIVEFTIHVFGSHESHPFYGALVDAGGVRIYSYPQKSRYCGSVPAKPAAQTLKERRLENARVKE
jgi:hypothetical protein